MTEQFLVGHQFIGVLLRHFDEIAQHAIMLDAKLAHPAFAAIAAFQGGNDAAGFVAQLPQFIQRRMRAPSR